MYREQFSGVSGFLIVAGVLLLVYAAAGNYIALPGYIRFLERGGTSPAGNTFDLAVLIGATKTIVWMYSFQLGVLALGIAYAIREGLYTKYVVCAALVWLALWSWPSLPAPGAWFYITFGGMILVAITLVLLYPRRASATDTATRTGATRLSGTLQLGAVLFFAIATWEVCGLGSAGRMLHPEQAAMPLAHNILITQSSKLMLEFVLAWGLLLMSIVTRQKQQG